MSSDLGSSSCEDPFFHAEWGCGMALSARGTQPANFFCGNMLQSMIDSARFRGIWNES
jgi:hypothetical protein